MAAAREEERVCEKREREEEEEERLTPWEQHASIISIPRFDYRAPSSLLHHSHSGFLVTCSIKREKSATKEVMSILGKVLPISEEKAQVVKSPDESKRRKLCAQEIEEGGQEKTEPLYNGENLNVEDLKSSKESIDEEHESLMSLVKLTKSGLLLFTFPVENLTDTTLLVSRIFQLMEYGSLKAPIWCHRIFPVQATCTLTEKNLRETVSKLVQGFLDDKDNTLSKPVKFAAGYNRRGVEESKGKVQKEASEVLEQCPLLDRTKCFETVAAGVKDIVPDSVVDLKTPELCVMVELLPLSRIPSGSFIAAVSVLPHRLVSTKPKLCIKPLVPNTKQKKRQN